MKHPKYCCQFCGWPIGYLGRFFRWLFGWGWPGAKCECTRSEQ